jgi:hypothetical protein
MSISLITRLSVLAFVCGTVVLNSSPAKGDPFSATYTTRESKRITSIGAVAPFPRTYSALTRDSKDLTFYESKTGRMFISFASKDGTIDDLGQNRCSTTSHYQVYWADKYQNLPAVCVSTNYNGTGGGNNNSIEPMLGGSNDDEGRYVAYETDATDVVFLVPTNTPTQTPTPTPTFTGTPGAIPATPTPVPPTPGRPIGARQVAFHDRKWGFNIPTCSKCDVGSYSYSSGGTTVTAKGCNGASENIYLWQVSDSGKDLLLSTSAFNMRDTRSPECADGNPTADVFIRDGSQCVAGAPGACFTKVIDDNTGYQIYDPTYETLDADVQNVQMIPDGSVVVFDTFATNPMHFTPDIGGFIDVYRHSNDRFKRITEGMVPFCSTDGKVLPLTNEFGPANNHSQKPTIDSTGRLIAFESLATDMVVWEGNPNMKCSTPGAPHPDSIEYISTGGLWQIYVYDHLTKKIELVSSKYRSNSADRMQGGNGNSTNARITRDGRFVFFESTATDLLQTATTSVKNIFMYDRYLKRTFLVTTGTGGTGLNQAATLTHVSTTSLSIAFETKATNVVVEGPQQGTSVGGAVELAPGGAATDDNHVYIARHSCPIDTDGDLVPDCSGLDSCPNDQRKTEPQVCGCGVAETDTDGDFTPDCTDGCKNDPKKNAAGQCGCGAEDTDSDFDGTADCSDSCPFDNSKANPGKCGCGVSDVDTDLDGSPDCLDSCPTDPAKTGKTGCPCGSLKDVPGACGCNIADNDDNGNGQADCLDPTAATQPTAAAYVTTKINLAKKKTYNILRIRMQNFGGKVTYSYTLTKGTYKLSKTSKTSAISLNGLKSGTYTFSYSVSTGTGAKKVTTKIATTTIKVP